MRLAYFIKNNCVGVVIILVIALISVILLSNKKEQLEQLKLCYKDNKLVCRGKRGACNECYNCKWIDNEGCKKKETRTCSSINKNSCSDYFNCYLSDDNTCKDKNKCKSCNNLDEKSCAACSDCLWDERSNKCDRLYAKFW